MITSDSVQAADFKPHTGLQNALLGGINEYSVDPTAVRNLPTLSDGFAARGLWGNPNRVDVYIRQGYKVVTSAWMHKPAPGQHEPLQFNASVTEADGAIYRDGRQVLLLYTSETNHRRLMANHDEAAKRMQGGIGKYQSLTESDRESLARDGQMMWAEERMVGQHEAVNEESAPKKPVPPRVSMAGIKSG